MASDQNKTTSAAGNLDDLATPPGATPAVAKSAAKAAPTTLADLANAPDAPQPVVASVAVKAGLSGETVSVSLAQGEGASGKEAQFVRVNEHTWLVPRNVPTIVPIEAYHALNETLPPVADGGQAFASRRFSVSILERFAA